MTTAVTALEIRDILAFMPVHRYRHFLLVDRREPELEPAKRIKALKNVSIDRTVLHRSFSQDIP